MKTSLPKGWISKPMADVHQNDKKANKLLIISPVSVKADSIVLRCGKSYTQVLPYYDKYEVEVNGKKIHKGYRYYSPRWGYQIAEDAIKKNDSPLLEVWANGKKYGVINPGFRESR